MTDSSLVVEAIALCDDLEDLIRRMTLPDDDTGAYNDYHRERIEDMLVRASARLERRKAKGIANDR